MPSADPNGAADGGAPPLNAHEQIRLALSARQRGDLAGAVKKLEAVSTAAPQNLELLVQLANLLRESGRLEEAATLFARVLSQSPGQHRALLGLGVIAKQRGNLSEALAHFEAAASSDPENLDLWVWEIGGILRAMNRREEAEAIYLRALAKSPKHVGALAGLGKIARERGDLAGALVHFKTAAALEPQNLDLQVWDLAHTLRALGYLDEARGVYTDALSQAPQHSGALAGLGHIAKRRNRLEEALALFQAAAKSDQRSLEVQAEIGHTLLAMQRTDEATAAYGHILEQAPAYVAAILGLGYAEREREQWPSALAHFEAAASLQPVNPNIQLEIAHTLRLMDHTTDAELVCRRILERTPGHSGTLMCLGLMARRHADWPAALEYFEAAAAADPSNPRPQYARASVLRELLRIDEAWAILRELEANSSAQANGELQARKLEHYCHTLQIEQATDCLASWGSYHDLPNPAVTLASALLATRGQWREVLKLFRERVVEQYGIAKLENAELLLEAVARATRATGEYDETLSLIARMPGADKFASIRDLRDQLIEEAQWLRSFGLYPGGKESVHGMTIGTPLRLQRSALLTQLLAPPRAAEAGHRTVYLCTDSHYLPGAVVTVCSLMRHNLARLRGYSLLIFCSDEIFELASDIYRNMADFFSVPIDLRNSSSLVRDDCTLRTGWGMFTPGHGLSEAAYHRIYAARRLLNEGKKGRLLYLDSDICVGPHLDQLLEFDLRGYPLGARRDDPNIGGIRRAALKLKIPPEEYFNSGVLLFDLSHPKLKDALDRAIEVSHAHKDLLSFLDQCALNLAFQALVAPLPQEFNLFVRQETATETLASNPVVRHFLHRPKPWDPMYNSANCTPWWDEFSALRHILGPQRIKRLLALQFSAREQS